MGVCRRAALYLARKKGKAFLLFLIYFLVSALLQICCSVSLLGGLTALKAGGSCLQEKRLPKPALRITGAAMFPSFFNPIT